MRPSSLPALLAPLLPVLPLLPLLVPGAQVAQDTDPELAALAERSRVVEAEVAELRGLAFLRAVPLRLADSADFLAYVESRLALIGTDAERAALADAYKLLGLVPADLDVWDAAIRGLATQVGGWYDPADGTFSIMRGLGDAATRAVLAHELVHALDDQHLDLDQRIAERSGDSDAQTALHAVVEGVATQVQNRWVVQHVRELDLTELAEATSLGGEELFQLPEALWLPTLFLYLRGPAFLAGTESVLKSQLAPPDPARIERAYAEPPRSTEQVLHPEKYWDPAAADEPVAVALAAEGLPEGWSVAFEDTLGEQLLACVVRSEGERQTVDLANPAGLLRLRFTAPAAEGWGGDRFAVLARDGARVLALHAEWDTPEDADEFHAALEARVETLRANAAALPSAAGAPGGVLLARAGERGVTLAVAAGLTLEDAAPVLAAARFAAAAPEPAPAGSAD